MINLEESKIAFDEYAKKFDFEDKNISLKYYHSLRVSKYAENIATHLKLSEEDIELATLIGLLHDIGRFEQETKYKSYYDIKTVDHGDLGCKVLFEDGLIKEFINTDKYNDIIKNSIYTHNKYAIPDTYNDREYLFSSIIRDADKLDILSKEYVDCNDLFDGEDALYTEKIVNHLKNCQLIDYKDLKTRLDTALIMLSYVYDIHYDYSLKLLRKARSIDHIIDKLCFKIPNLVVTFIDIKDYIYNYIDNKLGSDNDVR